MLTILYGIGKFNGAGIVAILFAGCLAAVFGLCLLFRHNRKKAAMLRLIRYMAVSSLLCDILLFMILFPGGEYRNYGIGASFGLLCYPASTAAAAAVASAFNREENENKSR